MVEGFFMKHETNLVWLDCEMTGLNIETDVILEISCVITDSELNVLAQGPSLVIHQSDHVLEAMGPWCQKQHKKSGLYFDVQQSQITLEIAQEKVLDFLKMHVVEKKAPLCGSSVWVDRMYLMKYMPAVNDYLHYRNVDVAAIKELVGRWYTFDLEAVLPKKDLHRAEPDIYESINELKYYKETFFIPQVEQ
jgi:oligoribonuclease